MQAPYDRERGQAPGGGDPSGWQGEPQGQQNHQGGQAPQGGYPAGYDPAYQNPPGAQPRPPEGYHGQQYGQQPDPRAGEQPPAAGPYGP
ncbi:DUF2662 domain-containing protein, partial [Streptomyces hainanensis]